jgi:hypothetical protein
MVKMDRWRRDVLEYRWMLKIVALGLMLLILMDALNHYVIENSCRTCT